MYINVCKCTQTEPFDVLRLCRQCSWCRVCPKVSWKKKKKNGPRELQMALLYLQYYAVLYCIRKVAQAVYYSCWRCAVDKAMFRATEGRDGREPIRLLSDCPRQALSPRENVAVCTGTFMLSNRTEVVDPKFGVITGLLRSNRHTPSGQSRVYRVTQLRTDGVHYQNSPGTGPVNLQGSSRRVLPWQVTMDQITCACLSFPQPLLV